MCGIKNRNLRIKDIHLKNFRSFEDCSIEFEDYYTAICGKNNSGKSNIIRAILNVLERPRYNRKRINYHSDFPIWKSKSLKEQIAITIRIQLDKNADVGLIKFLKVFLQDIKDDSEEFEIKDTTLVIKIELSPDAGSTEIIVDERTVTDKYKVGEILRRIHFAQVNVFHNSTQPDNTLRHSHHGQVDNLNSKTKELIEGKVSQIKNYLRPFKNISQNYKN